MSASKGNLHERLRAATRPLHEELELAVSIGERIATRTGYIDHLKRLLGLHVAVENSLQNIDFAPLGFVYPAPYRSRLLAKDLSVLDVGPQDLQGVPIPPAPKLETIPAALGCLYVVEGSAKGARSILPAIRASLGIDAETGAAFFEGFGQETRLLWQALVAAINRITPVSKEGDRAVEAAIATFHLFRDELAVQGEPVPSSQLSAASQLQVGP
jgi:heme oxygenase